MRSMTTGHARLTNIYVPHNKMRHSWIIFGWFKVEQEPVYRKIFQLPFEAYFNSRHYRLTTEQGRVEIVDEYVKPSGTTVTTCSSQIGSQHIAVKFVNSSGQGNIKSNFLIHEEICFRPLLTYGGKALFISIVGRSPGGGCSRPPSCSSHSL